MNYLSDTLKTRLNLYNGIEHPGYFRNIKGFAFLDSAEAIEGRVKYDGVWFTIPMQYDLYAEKLVIVHFNKSYKISLISEKVEEFIIHERFFRNFSLTESRKNGLSGLCEVLYEGDSISVYAKKRKLLNERSTSNGLEREFISSHQYYMRINGNLHLVKSKRDVLRLMGSKKNDVIAQLKKTKNKFQKNKEEVLITASKVYDEKI